jgi:RNA-binding protein
MHFALSKQQQNYLRGLGHHLDPIVHVGKEGISDGLCAAVEIALDQHELLKLKLGEHVPGERHELAEEIARRCHATLVQIIGRTLLLYRRRPDSDPRPHISLGPP